MKLAGISKNVKYNFQIDSTAAVFQWLFYGSIFPFVAVIALRLGASNFMVSLIVASVYFAQALAIPAAAIMGGRKKLPFLIWPGFAHKLFLVSFAFVFSPLTFVIVIIIFHLVESFLGPAYVSLIHVMYPEKTRGKLTSRVWVFGFIGSLIASLCAGYLLDLFSYRVIFPIAVFFGLISTFVFMKVRIKEKVEKRSSKKSLIHILSILKKDKSFLLYLIGITIARSGFFFMLPLLPLFLVKLLGLTNFQVGILIAVQSTAHIVTLIFWGKRIDEKRPLRVVVESMILLIPFSFFFFFSNSIYTIWPAYVLLGASIGGNGLAVVNLMGSFTSKKRISDYFALNQTFTGLRGFIVPFAATISLIYFSIRFSFIFALILLVLGTLFLMFNYGKMKK